MPAHVDPGMHCSLHLVVSADSYLRLSHLLGSALMHRETYLYLGNSESQEVEELSQTKQSAIDQNRSTPTGEAAS